MGDMEDELGRIYHLVGELSGMWCLTTEKRKLTKTAQLTANRAIIKDLKTRSDNVRGQAMHVGTGFPLRRFNLDIADGKLPSPRR